MVLSVRNCVDVMMWEGPTHCGQCNLLVSGPEKVAGHEKPVSHIPHGINFSSHLSPWPDFPQEWTLAARVSQTPASPS